MFKNRSKSWSGFAVAIILLLFAGDLPAQPDTSGVDYLLNDLQIKSISSVKINTKNLLTTYRFQKINPGLVRVLSGKVIELFQQKGYYIASLDSFKIEKLQNLSEGRLILFMSAGPAFILKEVRYELPDSLLLDYKESIDEHISEYTGKIYTESLQSTLFYRILTEFENSGYPLCRISTEKFTLDSLQNYKLGVVLHIAINPGPEILIAGLKLPPESDIDVSYLEKSFRFKSNEIYRKNRIDRYEKILRRQDFIKTAGQSVLVKNEEGKYFLKLDFEKAPSTTLDGVVGYIPPPANDPDESGYFTGLFNIGLKNLFGTGRRMDVYWQKPDRFSEEFKVRYREPYLLGLPFHVGGLLHRLVRDTTYIEWEYSLNTEVPINENLSGFARLFNREVFPDSLASRQLRLPQTSALHTEIGLRWDTRDDPYNPKSGLVFSAYFDYGTQKNVGPAYLLQEDSLLSRTNVRKVTGEAAFFRETFKNQVLALNFRTVLIAYQGEQVRPPDMFWFGGATTIRGYRENQFFGDQVGWLNTEYRFLIGPQSRLFVFADFGYYSRNLPDEKEEYLIGYGAGLSFPGPLGILQVDYGLARNLNFSEGKIHFRIINEF